MRSFYEIIEKKFGMNSIKIGPEREMKCMTGFFSGEGVKRQRQRLWGGSRNNGKGIPPVLVEAEKDQVCQT